VPAHALEISRSNAEQLPCDRSSVSRAGIPVQTCGRISARFASTSRHTISNALGNAASNLPS
jgi:hypothetical protein